jgi:hypothetical protein
MRRSLLLLLLLTGCARAATPETTYAPPAPIRPALPSTETPQSAQTSVTVPALSVPEVFSPYGPDTFAAFAEMQQDDPKFPRPRWESSLVSSAFVSSPTPEDMATFASLNDSLHTLSGVPTFTAVSSSAAVSIYFLPKSRWAEIDMGTAEMSTISGYTRTLYQDGRLLGAVIVVDSALDQPQRNKTLVHELVHALGLGHHSCAGGMMFSGSTYDPSWFFNEYDLTMLEAWYSDDPARILKPLPCPAVKWDVVRSSTETGNMTLWCRKDAPDVSASPVQVCFEVSPISGPLQTPEQTWFRTADGGVSAHDPERFMRVQLKQQQYLCEKPTASKLYAPCEKDGRRIVSRPDAWFDGSNLTVYDPERYVAFSFEGRRLLCEKPSPAVPYTPCQFTEGSAVSAVDLYTDGTKVYEEIPK